MKLYERSGFRRISCSMGRTGHGGCNTFYLLDL
jgi:putative acetyltransferase